MEVQERFEKKEWHSGQTLQTVNTNIMSETRSQIEEMEIFLGMLIHQNEVLLFFSLEGAETRLQDFLVKTHRENGEDRTIMFVLERGTTNMDNLVLLSERVPLCTS